MRIYPRHQVCPFRFTRDPFGVFSNFQPLAVPIAAGPWSFRFSESLYQAAKFPAHPDIQQRIAEAPSARAAAAIGRTPGLGIDPDWNARRVDVMRWVLGGSARRTRSRSTRCWPRPASGRSSRSLPATPGGARAPSASDTRGGTSSAGSGWNSGNTFARTLRRRAPAPGPGASASAGLAAPSRAPPARPRDGRCSRPLRSAAPRVAERGARGGLRRGEGRALERARAPSPPFGARR